MGNAPRLAAKRGPMGTRLNEATSALVLSYAYFSEHVVGESNFRCDAKTIECRMDIHVRRMAKCRMDIHVRRMARISDMNVQATGMFGANELRLQKFLDRIKSLHQCFH